MNDIFQALAAPSRRQLLEALRQGERSVSDLVEETGMSQPAVSKQLRILRNSGVVTLHSAGRQHLYSIREDPLREACDWLSYHLRFWQEGLTRMDRALQRKPRSERRTKR